jgi:DNA-binding LytR/AlgR family response regulator
LCDDKRGARFTLRCLLENIFEKRELENDIFEFSSGDRLLNWAAKNAGKLDLIFLDIEMDGLDGMETAKRLRETDGNLQIVFLTGHSEYVFSGYAVGALDYLMKPPVAHKVDDILTRALSALHKGSPDDFICKNSEGMFRVPKASILFFTSEKRVVTCVTSIREYAFYAKLDDVEREAGKNFVRIHQRYLVNAANVERVGGGVSIGGQELPMSRAYQQAAILALTRALLK